MTILRLGLIGDNIAASSAPFLHESAGRLLDIKIDYQRLVPKERNQTASEILAWAKENGFRGLNITYPYKELIAKQVDIEDPLIEAMGAVNTVLFGEKTTTGYNTDCSGFVSAWRENMNKAPESVLIIGAGGVGRAVGFALVALGVKDLRIFDRDPQKALALKNVILLLQNPPLVQIKDRLEQLADGVEGILNCTPVGMVGYPGIPISTGLIGNAHWVFDAVYTPLETEFLRWAKEAGLQTLSGYELFFYQGVDAFALFTGQEVDQKVLRQVLLFR